MKKILSGEGATDLGSAEGLTIVAGEGLQRPTIAPVVQEIDNLRDCVTMVRDYAEVLIECSEHKAAKIVASGVLGILDEHGL